MVEFGEWLCGQVVKAVPLRHMVFSIPKILRCYFLYDRKLLSDLSRCGWEALKLNLKKAVRQKQAVSEAVIAIQSFGDFLGFNPHLHILISDGCFHESGMFSVAHAIDTDTLEKIFRHIVLKMLLDKGKISPDVITLLDKWRHTGFNAYCGPRILPWQESSMENLARYYGYYSNVLRGKRKPSPVANAPLIIPDSYPIPRCRDEALGEGRSVDDYVIDPDYPVETYL